MPFVDICLFDQHDALPLPERYLPVGSKPSLRAIAYATVGRAPIDRQKHGFKLPIARWLSHKPRETVAATLLDLATCTAIYFRSERVAEANVASLRPVGLLCVGLRALLLLLRWSARKKHGYDVGGLIR